MVREILIEKVTTNTRQDRTDYPWGAVTLKMLDAGCHGSEAREVTRVLLRNVYWLAANGLMGFGWDRAGL